MSAVLVTTAFVATRLTGMILIIPGLGSRFVSWRIRGLLIMLLTAASVSVLPPVTIASSEPVMVMMGLTRELIVGMSLGLAPAVMIWGLQLAAQSVGGMTGLPTGMEEPDPFMAGGALSRFLTITALTVFFASGGHRHAVQGVLMSFEWLPPAQTTQLDLEFAFMMQVLSQSFALGVRVVSPIGVSLFASLLALTVINRVVPQMGYLAIGMSTQNLVVLGSLTLFLGGMGWILEAEFESVPVRIQALAEGILNHGPDVK